jgi:hypothetical protein
MEETPFTRILHQLIRRLRGAYGAVLVDSEGETVDYAGDVVPYEIRVTAAYLQIVARQIEEIAVLGRPRFMIVRGSTRSVVARAMPEAYVLGVLLRRRAGFTASQRAFSEAERALAREAGWTPSSGRVWYAVDVDVDRRGRPVRVAPDVAVEVIGTVVGLTPREQGFRVRTAAGLEVTLVREARSTWYADEALEAPPAGRGDGKKR